MRRRRITGPSDPWRDRQRREMARLRRKARAERVSNMVREMMGDGPLARAVCWVARVLLEMEPPGPVHLSGGR